MLVVSYGITKSGSTLAFAMTRAMLEERGLVQRGLPAEVVGADRGLLGNVTRERMRAVLAAIGSDETIVVKTHAGFRPRLFPWLESLVESGQLQVQATYRDPRDVCLSLLDAGRRNRRDGALPFREIVTVDHAAAECERQIRSFRRWAALGGAVRLSYDELAFDPDIAISAVEEQLGFTVDHRSVKQRMFERAAGQKNKAIRNRHQNELTALWNQKLLDRFETFITRVCIEDDQRWFDAVRRRLVEGESAEPPGKRVKR